MPHIPDSPTDALPPLVVVATYNEIENLPLLVEAIFGELGECHILVIDDNSPDGTGKWCDDYQRSDSRLFCLHRSGKLGLGSATVAGMQWGIEHGYSKMITMDADFSHPPSELPHLVDKLSSPSIDADVIVGSRYVHGGKISGWPLSRRIMSRCVNLYARTLLWLPVRDCSGAFRAYNVDHLIALPPESIRSRGYAYLEEILWRLKRSGARFHEHPIHFQDRTRGKTKINWKEAAAALWHIMRFGFQNLIPSRKTPS